MPGYFKKALIMPQRCYDSFKKLNRTEQLDKKYQKMRNPIFFLVGAERYLQIFEYIRLLQFEQILAAQISM